MKRNFWRADWFVGVVIGLVFALASGTTAMESLERTVYDWGVQSAQASPSDRVAVIAIDDESIANMGRWPWPRDRHARLIEELSQAGAEAIGYTVLFLEPQIDPGLRNIRSILDYYQRNKLGELPRQIPDATVAERVSEHLTTLRERLERAERELDTDRQLAHALDGADNVVLGMPFRLGIPRGKPEDALPAFVRANRVANVASTERGSARFVGLPAKSLTPPIEPLGRAASALGHLNFNPDVDGSVRSEALVVDYFGDRYPSMSLMLAARSLNLGTDDITINPSNGVRLGNLEIGTNRALEMKTFFYDERSDGSKPFPIDSFHAVMSGQIPPEKYKDKVVLVGATATGVGDAQVTPISAATPPVITLAHGVSSILEEDFLTQPSWNIWAYWGTFLVVLLYLCLLVPRLNGGLSAMVAVLLLLALVGTEYTLLVAEQTWLQLASPAAFLLVGYTLMMTKRYLATERGKMQSDAESAESNRMLGLSFQSQGQLDMAFEKYRKCPLDDNMMEVLYNLALDYERKRQFNKAGNVYDYMTEYDPDYRDIQTRRKRSKAMEDTVVLGAGQSGGGTMALDGTEGVEKPKLGRYDVEKELGKGAMGTVYQGRDPKINRVVAIKTLALSQEFEEDEVEEVKNRFFREAETAGRLNHSNIVTIYDAGEEHDLAYISMEYLQGKDLTPYTKPDHLLPLERGFEIIAQCGDALGYAHEHNVVHRDVKPGNVMYEPESGTLKITDFGIARITDSSKTKTGMVLGTPSYMSPEQLAGKKVDGRSDLFSLGVMFYQLLTGQLPFSADSMATLMYRIANEQHTPVLDLRSDLPKCAAHIVDRALDKDPDNRYRDGHEMARAIRECASSLGGNG